MRPSARSLARAVVALCLLLGGLVAGGSGTAYAGVGPCDVLYVCVSIGHGGGPGGGGGGSGGGGGGGGGGSACSYQGTPMACYIPGIGWLSSQDGCYYMPMQPQPAAGDPLWQGHQPGDGVVYIRTCALVLGGGTVSVWLAAPPPLPPHMTPGEVAAWAFAQIPRSRARIGSAPGSGQKGLVDFPVMLWLDQHAKGFHRAWVTKNNWAKATASISGLSVTAYAWTSSVDWSVSQGNSTVGQRSCNSPGVPFTKTFVNSCTYSFPQAGHGYVVTATVVWSVIWTDSNGDSGVLPDSDLQVSNSATLDIDSLQVLN